VGKKTNKKDGRNGLEPAIVSCERAPAPASRVLLQGDVGAVDLVTAVGKPGVDFMKRFSAGIYEQIFKRANHKVLNTGFITFCDKRAKNFINRCQIHKLV
jgi:hypothetical protein